MCQDARPFVVLMADDDAEDCLLVRDAAAEARLAHVFRFVSDGEALFDYLGRRGPFAEESAPRPDLVLLDLNMPKKDGREALRQLKADPRFRDIPVVVLTTSTTEDDVAYSYRSGANSFMVKPATYQAWIDLVRDLCDYWFRLVRLPRERP